MLFINLINSHRISNSNKNELTEGLKTMEKTKEATKESSKSKEAIAIELELEKHRMKLKHKKRVIFSLT